MKNSNLTAKIKHRCAAITNDLTNTIYISVLAIELGAQESFSANVYADYFKDNEMKKLLLAITLMFTSFATLAETTVSTNQALVIDVRSQEEWNSGHLEDAILLPHTDIANQIVEYSADPQQVIYLYCRSGNRAGYAKTLLEELGYENVYNLGSVQQASETLGLSIADE